MAIYSRQFSSELNFPINIKPHKTLIIASTPRCGSHMLGHSLYETKKFGFPLEYVQHANLIEWKKILNTKNINKTIEALQNIRTSQNGVFSVKLHYGHLDQFESFKSALKLFPDPYFVLLTRHNALRQAISYSIAAQTGVWIDGQESNGNQLEYNFENINNKLNIVLKHNTAWRYLLVTHNCNFIEIDFDHAKENIQATIKNIADFMNVQLDINDLNFREPPTKQQKSNINDEWFDKFLKDYNGQEFDGINNSDSRFTLKKSLKSFLSIFKLK